MGTHKHTGEALDIAFLVFVIKSLDLGVGQSQVWLLALPLTYCGLGASYFVSRNLIFLPIK